MFAAHDELRRGSPHFASDMPVFLSRGCRSYLTCRASTPKTLYRLKPSDVSRHRRVTTRAWTTDAAQNRNVSIKIG